MSEEDFIKTILEKQIDWSPWDDNHEALKAVRGLTIDRVYREDGLLAFGFSDGRFITIEATLGDGDDLPFLDSVDPSSDVVAGLRLLTPEEIAERTRLRAKMQVEDQEKREREQYERLKKKFEG